MQQAGLAGGEERLAEVLVWIPEQPASPVVQRREGVEHLRVEIRVQVDGGVEARRGSVEDGMGRGPADHRGNDDGAPAGAKGEIEHERPPPHAPYWIAAADGKRHLVAPVPPSRIASHGRLR